MRRVFMVTSSAKTASSAVMTLGFITKVRAKQIRGR